jgi:capsular polysaccharide biosynthesis protein
MVHTEGQQQAVYSKGESVVNAEAAMVRRAAVASLLIAVAVSVASLLQTPKYEASAQVLVGERSPAQEMGSGKIQLIPLAPTPERVEKMSQAMAGAIDTRPVAQEALRRLGLKMSPEELLNKLVIEQVESTNFIRLSYEGTDPVQAKQIVNTVGEVSSERISQISAAGSNLTATVYEKAIVPTTPVSPTPARHGVITLVVGLGLSVGLMAGRGVLRP